MRRFKSAAHLQRFASVHSVVQNLFRVGRHLLRSVHHRPLRSRAFAEWEVVTCCLLNKSLLGGFLDNVCLPGLKLTAPAWCIGHRLARPGVQLERNLVG